MNNKLLLDSRVIMDQQKIEYKSPVAALLWSLVMTGFGQFYNGQYIFGTLLFLFELTSNVFSSLNMSIFHSFHSETQVAHDTFNHQWGLFYPSTYAFSMWQAYNKAIVINCHKQGKDTPNEVYLTGFFISFVIGMNLGVYYHHLFDNVPILSFLHSPIFNGPLFGIVFGFIGHFIEKYWKKRRRDFDG